MGLSSFVVFAEELLMICMNDHMDLHLLCLHDRISDICVVSQSCVLSTFDAFALDEILSFALSRSGARDMLLDALARPSRFVRRMWNYSMENSLIKRQQI